MELTMQPNDHLVESRRFDERVPYDVDGALRRYCSAPYFQPQDGEAVQLSPYRRALQLSPEFTLTERPLRPSEISTATALAAHRVLFNVYEHDLIFLPVQRYEGFEAEFRAFYAPEMLRLGGVIRPDLERMVFSYLNEEIDVTGPWSEATTFEYFDHVVAEHDASESSLAKAVVASADPERAARHVLIQCAGDFLTEASGMARNLPGNFGEEQSSLFRIFIDEYGYGRHDAKHSTLYEKLMLDCGLSPLPHAYFCYYLPSSLAIHNYIHWVSQNHTNFFRYLGALYFAEATYSHTCELLSRMLRAIFGSRVDTTYFDEHVHIDRHHRRMVGQDIIRPLQKRLGSLFLADVIRGFEEFRKLLDDWGTEVRDQLMFLDGQTTPATATTLVGATLERHASADQLLLDVDSRTLAYRAVEGEIDLVSAIGGSMPLNTESWAKVPAGRLHGLKSRGQVGRYLVRETSP
jgi:hypothetical protein